jgi:hypothetical protein
VVKKKDEIYVYLSECDGEWLLHVDINGVLAITTEHKTKSDAVSIAKIFYREEELSREIKEHNE